ncbi:MAG TPA: hypothetical protein VMU89_09390 [Thermomicrobiaceae bacterium]|nr:hypothetical protein [Thermomicrobiaceae bacterium]
MQSHRRAIKILLPDGELLTLLGSEVRFEPFFPEEVRARLAPGEAETMALVCLDTDGHEVGRVKVSAILGYLTE